MSIGQEEDTRAFDAMRKEFWNSRRPPTTTHALEFAFKAGMKRGESKRGCCEKPDAS